MNRFRSWLFTPRGALIYFGVGYALIALGVLGHAYAGSLPTVGAIPTAAGRGVTASTVGGSAVTSTPRTSTSTSAGFGNPSANASGTSAASTPGSGLVRAPAAALTAASGASGTGAAAAVGVGNVSHSATTQP